MKKIAIIVALNIIFILNCIPVYAQTAILKAKVVNAEQVEELENKNEPVKRIQNVTVRILEEYKEEEYDLQYVLSEDIKSNNAKPELKVGDKVTVNLKESDDGTEIVTIQEIVRQNYIICITLILIALLVLIGRKKSVKLILTILITIAIIYFIFILNVKKEYNMLLLAFITSTIVILANSIIENGISKKSVITFISSIIGVIICTIIAFLLCNTMRLIGNIFSDLVRYNGLIDLKEILYSVIILSSTGITLAISNGIIKHLEKIKQENKNIEMKELLKSGLDEGIKNITKIINIPIIILLCFMILPNIFEIEDINFFNLINNENIITILLCLIIMIISGVITIPITTIIYIILNKSKIIYKTKSDNIIEGQRSLKL